MEDIVEALHAQAIAAMRDHAHRCWERALDLGPHGSGYAELLSTAELYYTRADEMQARLGCQSPAPTDRKPLPDAAGEGAALRT